MTTFDNPLSTASLPPSTDDRNHWTKALHGLWQTVGYPDRFFAPGLRASYALAPLAVLALIKIVLIRAQLPYVLQAILRTLPDSVAAEYINEPGRLLAGRLWMQYAGGVVTPMLVVAVMAGLLYLVSLSMGHLGRFANFFVAAAYGWLIYGLKAIFTFILLTLRGLGSISGPESLQPSVGLGLLFRDGSPAFQAMVDTVNLFDLWLVFVLAIAVHKSEKLSPKTAATIASGAWLIFHGFRLGFIYLFQQVAG